MEVGGLEGKNGLLAAGGIVGDNVDDFALDVAAGLGALTMPGGLAGGGDCRLLGLAGLDDFAAALAWSVCAKFIVGDEAVEAVPLLGAAGAAGATVGRVAWLEILGDPICLAARACRRAGLGSPVD